MSFMQRFAYKIRSFMYGRYGMDQLGLALFIFGMLLTLIFSFTVSFPWFYLAYIPYIFELYRMLSKKLETRRHENEVFLRIWSPISSWLKFKKAAFKDRKYYKYFRCPSCRLNLRAPRGKGKIQITCQRCHTKFTEKT